VKPAVGEQPRPGSWTDANLVLWAHHRQCPAPEAAREWWAETISTVPMVAVPWPTTLAFVRLSTHPRALERPLAVAQAWATAEGWLERDNVWVPGPTERHRGILGRLLLEGRASGNHAMDAHLAALAIEWGLELLSADRDFARYPGLRWRDPLSGAG